MDFYFRLCIDVAFIIIYSKLYSLGMFWYQSVRNASLFTIPARSSIHHVFLADLLPAFDLFGREADTSPAPSLSSLSTSARACAALTIWITFIQFFAAQIGNVTKARR